MPIVSVRDVDGALEALADGRKHVQRPAAERLGEAARDDPAVRAKLVETLASSDGRRRWGAAYALARLEPLPREAIPVLVEALGSTDGDLRWASARLLTRAIRDAPSLAEVIHPLVDAPSALQRKMALYCLRDAAGTISVARDVLARALGDGDPAVRLAAMAAVAALLPRSADTADLVAPLVDDVELGVRRAAAATVGQLGVRTPAVVAGLTRARASGDPTLERAASQALSRLDAAGSA